MPKENFPSNTTEQKEISELTHIENTIEAAPHSLKAKIHPLLLVDINPTRCKPWPYHNRDSAWLTKARCVDLIHSIQREGQLDPILVRTHQEMLIMTMKSFMVSVEPLPVLNFSINVLQLALPI